MIKFSIISVILQIVCLIFFLFFLLSDRSQYDDIVENYPMTQEGDKELTNHVFEVILQYVIGIVVFVVGYCLVKKETKALTEQDLSMTKHKR